MAGAPGPNGKTGAASERSDQPCRSALRRVGAGHAHVRERRLDLGFAGFSRAPRIRRGAALGKAGGFRPVWWPIRLEAARALGAIRTSGAEGQARRLLASISSRSTAQER